MWWDNWTGVKIEIWDDTQNKYVTMLNSLLKEPTLVDLTINEQTVSYKQFALKDDNGAVNFKISK